MSVLIKGMEMPKSCGDCNFYYTDYEEGTAICLATSCYVTPRQYNKGNRDSDCPLVEIPTPHGRLIDADTVEERLQKYWYEEYPNQEASYHRAFMDSNACVKDLPTIIEAEVSE